MENTLTKYNTETKTQALSSSTDDPDTSVGVMKTYKYKLKPTKEQEVIFEKWLGTCRYIYNLFLEYRIYLYSQKGISISKFDLIKELPEVKKVEGFEWIKEVHSATLQSVVEKLDRSYQNFFKRNAGFPKFAKKNRYRSFLFKNNNALTEIQVVKNKIKLPKIGFVKFFNSRDIVGKIKTATVSREADGWYISVNFEGRSKFLKKTDKEIGLNLGVRNFAHGSDNVVIENPRHYKKYENRLKVLQRSLSRKKKGGKNREKVRNQLAKLYQKLSNVRYDFLQKLSTSLISENQTIIVENLDIKKLIQKPKPVVDENSNEFKRNGAKLKAKFNNAILDTGWGMFCNMLKYKSEWYGRTFDKVEPHYTNMDCSTEGCGYRSGSPIPLNVLEWECPSCGVLHDRDYNSSKNILKKWRLGKPFKA